MTVGSELLDDAYHHVDRASTKNEAAGSLSDGLDELQVGTHHRPSCRSVGGGRLGASWRGQASGLLLRFFLAPCTASSLPCEQTANKNRRHAVFVCRHAVHDQLGSLRPCIVALS
jgi:hypothetical protein